MEKIGNNEGVYYCHYLTQEIVSFRFHLHLCDPSKKFIKNGQDSSCSSTFKFDILLN